MDELTDIPGLESEVYPMTMANQLYTFVCQSIVEESVKKEIEPFVVSADVLKSAFKFLADYQINNSNKVNGDQKHHFSNGLGSSNGHTLKHRTMTVFSSPYKSRKPIVSTELPSYVKKMMEKDASLRRLLKTGNVTISHIPHPSRLRGSNINDDYEEPNNDDYDDDSSPSNLNFGSNLLKRLAKKASATAVKQEVLSQESDILNNVKSNLTGFHRQSNAIPSKRKTKQQSHSVNRKRKAMESHKLSSSNMQKHESNNDRSSLDNSTTVVPNNDHDIDPTKFLEVSFREEEGDEHRRKYNCPHCPKRFNWSTDLKRHILTHTGERPFKCEYCPANFTRKFLMQKHARKHHQEQLPRAVDADESITNGHTNGYNDGYNGYNMMDDNESNIIEEEEEMMIMNEIDEDYDFVHDETDNVDLLESEDVAEDIFADTNSQVEESDHTVDPIIINVFSSLNKSAITHQDTLHLNGHSDSSNNSELTAPRKLNESMVKQLAKADVKNCRPHAQRRFISLVKS